MPVGIEENISSNKEFRKMLMLICEMRKLILEFVSFDLCTLKPQLYTFI